ncbi:helix-turn-helix domain-containing protein [Ancylobacter sp. IITR112]|uniref:helix-turn-helix domain-containing protein n=1 Tax=Ancylobacter sp. IITR112 TaxID=3138073 RepID=UPI00352B249B
MAKSIPANVNPRILQWARETARLTPEAAAKAVGVSLERLLACEAGDEQLTFNQFLAAANAYKRAPALLWDQLDRLILEGRLVSSLLVLAECGKRSPRLFQECQLMFLSRQVIGLRYHFS